MTPDPITVLWTSIPAGLQGRRARPVLSVLVSPRLRRRTARRPCSRTSRRSSTGRRPSRRCSHPFGCSSPAARSCPSRPSIQTSSSPTLAGDLPRGGHGRPCVRARRLVQAPRALVRGRPGLEGVAGACTGRPPPSSQAVRRSPATTTSSGWCSRSPAATRRRLGNAIDKAVDFHKPRRRPRRASRGPSPRTSRVCSTSTRSCRRSATTPGCCAALGLVIDLVLPDAAPRSFAPTLLCVRPHFRNSDLCPRTLAELDPSASPRSRTSLCAGRVAPDEDRGFPRSSRSTSTARC